MKKGNVGLFKVDLFARCFGNHPPLHGQLRSPVWDELMSGDSDVTQSTWCHLCGLWSEVFSWNLIMKR